MDYFFELEVSSCRIVDPKKKKKNSSSSKEEQISLKLYGNGWTLGEAQIITTCEVVAEIVDKKKTLFFLQRPPKRTKQV
jgi:hypothetical protein